MPIPYWKTFYGSNDEVYSCDKIRARIKVGDRVEEIHNYLRNLNAYNSSYNINYKRSFENFTYTHVHNIKMKDGNSFAIGLGWNGQKEKQGTGFIEFNPNKVAYSKLFLDIWNKIKKYFYKFEIVRYDLAIDLNIDRQYVHMPKFNNMRWQCILQDGKTESNGIHNNVGFTKVYDKTKEANLTYNCTRIEITLDLDTDIKEKLPDIFFTNSQLKFHFENKLTQNDKVFIDLLNSVDNKELYIKQLTYRKRQQFLPYLYSGKLEIDYKAYNDILYEIKKFQKEKIL